MNPKAPPAPQGSGEHKLVAERGNNQRDQIQRFGQRIKQLKARISEAEAVRDQALALGAEQVLEIQELRQVVKEYREEHENSSDSSFTFCGLKKRYMATRCDICIKADTLLEPKAKPTQRGDKE